MTTSAESEAGVAERDERVAVFVDVENILGWLKRGGCGELLSRARNYGHVIIRKAFGDFSNPTVSSRQVELQRHGFELVHTLHPAKGKSNSADISMTIDVMECCRGPEIQWVILATGDSDFGPVFRRLRELGKGVVGVGPSSVLSSSVTLSCHEFIFTDDHNGKGGNGSAKKRGKAGMRGERAAGHFGGGAAGVVSTRVATPPQLLSARGGFRFKHQQYGPPADERASIADRLRDADFGGRGKTPPLLLGAPATVGVGKGAVVATVAAVASPSTLPSTPPPPSPPPALPSTFVRLTLDGQCEQGIQQQQQQQQHRREESAAADEPFLAPGQLLLPEMVTAAVRTTASPPTAPSSPPGPSVRTPPTAAWETSTEVLTPGPRRSPPLGGGVGSSGTGGGTGSVPGSRLSPPTLNGLGALSVIRPSERLYRHLLALEPTTGAGAGSLASDWGNGLSEVTLAKGLVSLAGACGGADSEHARAVQALVGFASDESRGAGKGETTGGLGREEACRVGALLQRCGFLSWVAKEQQWLVTVPADMEVLRRRRDETMMEELRTRCQEAGVPFEPALAANLLWAQRA